MSNLDDTTTGTGPAQVWYANDDALDFRLKSDLDKKQEAIATNPRKFSVLVSIESASIGGITASLAAVSDKIAGGIPAGTMRNGAESYTFNKRVVE